MRFLKQYQAQYHDDETFTSNVSGATGTIISFDAISFLKYTATQSELEVGDTITTSGSQTVVVVKADTLTVTTTMSVQKITTTGVHINQDGHISENSKKIQDSLYYQDYSYVIRVSESINKWRDALKRAGSLSGFYVTGEVNIVTRVSGQVRQVRLVFIGSGLFSGTSDSTNLHD